MDTNEIDYIKKLRAFINIATLPQFSGYITTDAHQCYMDLKESLEFDEGDWDPGYGELIERLKAEGITPKFLDDLNDSFHPEHLKP